MVQSYKDLIVWQKSMSLVKEVYTITSKLPQYEMYGLANQLRRAAVSIPSNIAEGQQRKSTKEFLQFLRIAYGSAGEVETQLLIAHDLYSVDIGEALATLGEVRKMLAKLLQTLEDR